MAKKDEVSIQELSEWSGEQTVRRFKYVVPVLKFNGNTGKFTLLIPSESGDWVAEDIKKTELEFVVLKVRRVLSSYEKMPDGSGTRNFTNEHGSWKDKLTVFEMKKGDTKPRMIGGGTTEEVRNTFPNLRLRQNLYCLFNDQVVKLSARGKSLSSLFDYYQKFEATEHIFQFITQISSHTETNEGGLTYYVLDWEKGKESDLSVVAKNIKEVKESLELQDKQYAEMRDTPPEFKGDTEEKPEEEKPGEEKPEEKKKEGDEEEVKVEDIPL